MSTQRKDSTNLSTHKQQAVTLSYSHRLPLSLGVLHVAESEVEEGRQDERHERDGGGAEQVQDLDEVGDQLAE